MIGLSITCTTRKSDLFVVQRRRESPRPARPANLDLRPLEPSLRQFPAKARMWRRQDHKRLERPNISEKEASKSKRSGVSDLRPSKETPGLGTSLLRNAAPGYLISAEHQDDSMSRRDENLLGVVLGDPSPAALNPASPAGSFPSHFVAT
jgi:hypothetical protein